MKLMAENEKGRAEAIWTGGAPLCSFFLTGSNVSEKITDAPKRNCDVIDWIKSKLGKVDGFYWTD